MIDKRISADVAVKDVQDGAVIMVGGFMGTGTPEIIIDALVKKGVKNLTVICNDAGFAKGGMGKDTARGVGKLVEKNMVKHLIASHVGLNPQVAEQVNSGALELTLVPQGTLAEKLRASSYGLGGVLTPTGVGTPVEKDKDEFGREKQTLVIEGKKYLLELPLRADFAFIRASECDKFGNYICKKSTKTFNYVMTGAAKKTIIASEKVNEVGVKDSEYYTIPGVLVDAVVEGEKPWQI